MSLILSGTEGLSDVDGSAATPAIRGTDANTGIFFPAADTIAFAEGGAEVARFDSSGNFGLGVTPSAWVSTAKGIDIGTWSAFANLNSGAVSVLQNSWEYSAGAFKYKNTDPASKYDQVSGQHRWFNAASGTAGNAITFTQAMTLDASGNLGIGANISGSYKLEVNGNIVARRTNDNNPHFFSMSNSSSVCFLESINGLAASFLPINFKQTHTGTSQTPMILDASGNLLVGATSRFSGFASDNKLYVESSTGDYICHFRSTQGTPYGPAISFSTAPNNTTSVFIDARDSSAQRFALRSNGGIANYSANNVNLSDERTKTDIQNAGGYLAKICAIPVRTFKYKDQIDDLLNLGVIAQEVETVAPELVDVSGFGETPEDGVPLKAIYQTDLQYALMKCIQEQQALITQLTARISALESA